jgi:hypothetical protein
MNNYWKQGILPYSWNPKNVVLNWLATDNLENYNKNPYKSDWEGVDITYQFNLQGFRCPDLNNFLGQRINLALGCSFTEGTGLPEDQVWPSILEQSSEFPILNLGLGSGTTDTISRILTNVCSLYDIQTVYILWPSILRFESIKFNDFKIDPILPHSSKIEHAWYLSTNESINRFYKNQSIVQNLSKTYNFKILY